MGFNLDEIRKVMERKRHLSTEHYISVEALVSDLINAQRDNICSVPFESTLQKGENNTLENIMRNKKCFRFGMAGDTKELPPHHPVL